jgi:hypothetical protein
MFNKKGKWLTRPFTILSNPLILLLHAFNLLTHILAIKIPKTVPTRAPVHGLEVMIQTLPLHLPRYPISPPSIAPIAAPRIYLIMALPSLYLVQLVICVLT